MNELFHLWTLIVGGDIMLNAVAPGPKTFEGIATEVQGAEIAYANLEIPLTDRRGATPFKSAAEVKARTQYILKASPLHATHLAAAGFDAFSLGNNHAMDYRGGGLQQMMRLMQGEKIKTFGAGSDWEEARKAAVFEVAGALKIGFISFLSFNGQTAMRKCGPATKRGAGVATLTITGLSDAKARRVVRGIVEGAKRDCEFLVVCLHWGIERQTLPTSNQIRLGRMFIDEGADMVVGAHPHVLQPGELYKGKPILYSLGNLISPTPARAAMYRFSFDRRTLKKVEFMPTVVSKGRVVFAEGKVRDSAIASALSAQKRLETTFKTAHDTALLK